MWPAVDVEGYVVGEAGKRNFQDCLLEIQILYTGCYQEWGQRDQYKLKVGG